MTSKMISLFVAIIFSIYLEVKFVQVRGTLCLFPQSEPLAKRGEMTPGYAIEPLNTGKQFKLRKLMQF